MGTGRTAHYLAAERDFAVTGAKTGRSFFPYPAASVEKDPGAQEVLKNARRRVEPIAKLWGILQAEDGRVPSIDFFGLLASCYLQGVRDTAEVVVGRGWKPEDTGGVQHAAIR